MKAEINSAQPEKILERIPIEMGHISISLLFGEKTWFSAHFQRGCLLVYPIDLLIIFRERHLSRKENKFTERVTFLAEKPIIRNNLPEQQRNPPHVLDIVIETDRQTRAMAT